MRVEVGQVWKDRVFPDCLWQITNVRIGEKSLETLIEAKLLDRDYEPVIYSEVEWYRLRERLISYQRKECSNGGQA